MKNRKSVLFILFALFMVGFVQSQNVRKETVLHNDWKFTKGDFPDAVHVHFDDSAWQVVNVPHDWAIYGPFDRNNDLQHVAVSQNLETQASDKTGRTGGLPYVGVGWYRRMFNVPEFNKTTHRVSLVFDGAMSEAHVYVNGKEAIYWPYGYNSFSCDVTDLLNTNGAHNVLAVRLENRDQSSRWYSGAGLYRNVHLVVTQKVHIPVWGTYITTPFVSKEYASIQLKTKIDSAEGEQVRILTTLYDGAGNSVAQKDNTLKINHNQAFEQNFIINAPHLWSPETPCRYFAKSKVYVNGTLTDEYTTPFGVRSIQLIADKGFYLNGEKRKFQGVCLHHDLGPLGAAINTAAVQHQLTLLKNMGCDAIRTSHNMPAPELVNLCDSMGFMLMIEPFDEWDQAKCKNGYHRFFAEWAEKDMVNMIHHYRNHPSVVLWSIGNEVPTQCSADGYKVASFLQNICHREDPTRPVTCGMDQVSCVLENGFAALLDLPGFNYRVNRYEEAYHKLPQNLVLGSETSSTVSSRGVYKFPVEQKADARYDDHQSSSYDLEYCSWSNLPDVDFAMAEDHDWTLGQFVWTGFDYLGEPSPYDTNAWPSHSSLFGIIDLASIPKDRYYLYKSVWNHKEPTLHMLPHWNWKGREGQITPVFVYTSYPSAELFINGKSFGKQSKNSETLQNRYRLMWMNAVYEPGEVKVIAYNAKGDSVAEQFIHTAGSPHHLELTSDKHTLAADGSDLAYINVRVVDKDGNLCPLSQQLCHFSVQGAGAFKATANGDATCLDLFHLPQMHFFNGQLTVIVQSKEQKGSLTLEVTSNHVKTGRLTLKVE